MQEKSSAQLDGRQLSPLYRPRRAAALLGISVTTLWRMRRRGELAAPIRISRGAVGWPESVLREFIERRAEAAR